MKNFFRRYWTFLEIYEFFKKEKETGKTEKRPETEKKAGKGNEEKQLEKTRLRNLIEGSQNQQKTGLEPSRTFIKTGNNVQPQKH